MEPICFLVPKISQNPCCLSLPVQWHTRGSCQCPRMPAVNGLAVDAALPELVYTDLHWYLHSCVCFPEFKWRQKGRAWTWPLLLSNKSLVVKMSETIPGDFPPKASFCLSQRGPSYYSSGCPHSDPFEVILLGQPNIEPYTKLLTFREGEEFTAVLSFTRSQWKAVQGKCPPLCRKAEAGGQYRPVSSLF